MASGRIRGLIGLVLALWLTQNVVAITIVEVEVECPVCHTKNKFVDYASWGSYVYSWPSKFQLVFWPHTANSTIYSCSKCHLTLFMWDFKEFPKDKIADAAKLLESVKLSGEYKTYTDIPASEKLQIAEKVYPLLGKDDAFWSHFYRLLGYYLAAEKKPTEAAAARKKALEVAQRMLADPAVGGHKKELLVESAAMHHFLGDDPTALGELHSAAALTFTDPKLDEERSKGYDGFLSSLIKDYIPAIEKRQVPTGTE